MFFYIYSGLSNNEYRLSAEVNLCSITNTEKLSENNSTIVNKILQKYNG